MFSGVEIILITLQCASIGMVVLRELRSRDRFSIWKPTVLFSVIYLYYFVLGPFLYVVFDMTSIGTIDFRPYYQNAWLAGVVSYWSFVVGFSLPAFGVVGRVFRVHDAALRRMSIIYMVAIGLVSSIGFLYLISKIGLNPVKGSVDTPDFSIAGGGRGAFAGYIYMTMDFAVLVIVMLLHRWLRCGRGWGVLFFVLALFVALFWAKVGFRGRIVVMFLSCVAVYYIIRARRPSLLSVGVGGCALLLMAAVVVITRDTFSGLELGKLEGKTFSDLLLVGFQDCVIFGTLGAVIDNFPKYYSFVGIEPIWVALTIAIPRQLWSGKPMPDYILLPLRVITGTGGQAVPNIGEYYIAFGWSGVVIGSIVLGFLFKNMWHWFRANRVQDCAKIVYGVGWSLLFPIIIRGYLAQAVVTVVFNFGPAIVLAWLCSSSVRVRGS